jgi:uncharacterized protein YacL
VVTSPAAVTSALRTMPRGTIYTLAAAVIEVALIAVIGLVANWRLGLVVALIAGAIALTRLRYAPLVAVVVLAVTLVLALTGHTAGTDDRDVPAKMSQR